jgi:predicted nucleotidyltransferase
MAIPKSYIIFVEIKEKGMIMCTRQQCIEKLKASIPYIQKEFGVSSLCLFGSIARGDNREDSDVLVHHTLTQLIEACKMIVTI